MSDKQQRDIDFRFYQKLDQRPQQTTSEQQWEIARKISENQTILRHRQTIADVDPEADRDGTVEPKITLSAAAAQPAQEIPETAVKTNSLQISRFLKCANHTGLIDNLYLSELSFAQRTGYRSVFVIFRIPSRHEDFIAFVKSESATKGKRGSRKPTKKKRNGLK
jgi:hypothetical protein